MKEIFWKLIYNPFWAVLSQTIPYLWKDSDFSFARLRPKLNKELFTSTLPAIQISSWMVWIPAVSIIYSLPPLLQIPLFNIVLSFWVLLLSFVARKEPEAVLQPELEIAEAQA